MILDDVPTAESQSRSESGPQVSYKMKFITERQIWYEIVTYGLRDIYAKFKSTTLSAYQDIHT